MTYIILAAIAAAILIAFLIRRKKQQGISAGLTFNTISGVTIATEVPVDTFEAIKKIREGLQIAFDDAVVLGWSQKMSVSDYQVAILRRVGYLKNVAYFGDNLAGTSDAPRCLINVPDGFEPDAVRHEAEHCLLYYNDRDAYTRTAGPGHEHPLLPALIKERGLA